MIWKALARISMTPAKTTQPAQPLGPASRPGLLACRADGCGLFCEVLVMSLSFPILMAVDPPHEDADLRLARASSEGDDRPPGPSRR